MQLWHRQAFLDAIAKEATSWDNWGPVRPLGRDEAAAVLKDKILLKYILRSRFCYRDKNCGRDPLLAKARLVVSGFDDPDLHRLTRNYPTATLVGFFAVLQLASSMFAHGWDLLTADVSAALLQREQARIFVDLANAPYLWSLEVRRKMAEFDVIRHHFDVICFIHRDEDGNIDAFCVFHVDDALLAAAPTYDQDALRAAFARGDRSTIWRRAIKFIGKQLRRRGRCNRRVPAGVRLDYSISEGWRVHLVHRKIDHCSTR